MTEPLEEGMIGVMLPSQGSARFVPRKGLLIALLPVALLGSGAASASADEKYFFADGPKAGILVEASADGTTPKPGARRVGAGIVRPQAGSCNYAWEGKIDGVETGVCVVPEKLMTAAWFSVAYAIDFEELALADISANRPTREQLGGATDSLKTANSNLAAWGEAINAETTDPLRSELTAKKNEAAAKDAEARAKLNDAKDAGGQARRDLIDTARALITDALAIKRDGFEDVREVVPIPGEVSTDADSLPEPVNLTDGTATDILDPENVIGTHNPGLANSQGFFFDGDSPANLLGGTPSFPRSFALSGGVVGELGSGAAQRPTHWNIDSGYQATPVGDNFGSMRDGSDVGGVGFEVRNGKELPIWFKPNFDGADPGFRRIPIGDFNGGSSLFAVNDRGVGLGDAFQSGSSGPFYAWIAKLNRENVFRYPLPEDATGVQPFGINELGVGAGGALFEDSSLQGVFFEGRRQLTPYGGLGENTVVRGINDAGVGVGSIGSDAALFAEGGVFNLNDLIPNASTWDLTQANAIDGQGNIAGTGIFGGQQRAFLLRAGSDPVVNDLSLVKTLKNPPAGSPPEYQKGQAIHFVLTFTNHGPQEARDVKIVDHIPKHCKFVRASADKGGKPDPKAKVMTPGEGEDGGDVTVSWKKIIAGQTRVIHIVCKASVTVQETFTNKAEISTEPASQEPEKDSHPSTLELQYVIKP